MSYSGADRFHQGQAVWYDYVKGAVVKRVSDRPNGGDMWLVEWSNGKTGTVWGSDLATEELQ